MSRSETSPDGVDSRAPRRSRPLRCAAAALVAVVVLFFLSGREPRYQGKALSEWLGNFNRIPPDQPASETEEAIRAIGEKALPFLLSNIWTAELHDVSRVRIWINKTFTRTYRSRIDLCAPSWRALSILGPRARAAIPEIVKHAAEGPFKGRAMIALGVLGTNSIPALIALCGHSNAHVRVSAAFVLAKTKVEMRGVESFIGGSPFSEQPMLAYNIKKGPEDLSPLVENLKHGLPTVRQASLEAIGSIPALLKAAAPVLQDSLNDADPLVRATARHLLARDVAGTRSGKE